MRVVYGFGLGLYGGHYMVVARIRPGLYTTGWEMVNALYKEGLQSGMFWDPQSVRQPETESAWTDET